LVCAEALGFVYGGSGVSSKKARKRVVDYLDKPEMDTLLQPLAGDSTICYRLRMNTKHRKTLVAIFARPTSASIVFADIEALVKALGGSVSEREGSRVRIELNGEQ